MIIPIYLSIGAIEAADRVFVSQRIGPRMLDHEGKEVPGNRGYKYFGAARDLPGVRELFEKERTYLHHFLFDVTLSHHRSSPSMRSPSCPSAEEDEGGADEGRGCRVLRLPRRRRRRPSSSGGAVRETRFIIPDYKIIQRICENPG